jgi:carbamoyl-phosphate synthase small subunit
LQGIELNNGQAFGFQGHPEASPGPHDVAPLFDRFVELMNVGLMNTGPTSTGN